MTSEEGALACLSLREHLQLQDHLGKWAAAVVEVADRAT